MTRMRWLGHVLRMPTGRVASCTLFEISDCWRMVGVGHSITVEVVMETLAGLDS